VAALVWTSRSNPGSVVTSVVGYLSVSMTTT
jgi:hypothetical protein